MNFFSTRGKIPASFAQAALAGLAPDGGLFVPAEIPRYRNAVKNSLGSMSFHEIAFETIKPFVEGGIEDAALEELIAGAFSFEAPLIDAGKFAVLELFHGPTAAFKDFGARFMARAFACLRRGESRPLRILVATSGDTGGAVADGFFGVEGISVTVLYPGGRVSELQKKQIAGLGGNISALEVDGSFDDCQALVKAAFRDRELTEKLALSSANSINIARLIPQTVYYAAAAGRALTGRADPDGAATPRVSAGTNAAGTALKAGEKVTMAVPSGNFGNLTAGLYAYAMGAPIAGFIAATNINKTIPEYLESGEYKTRVSKATISNAMDVGAPSNFERMNAHWSLEELRRVIRGVSVNDDDTRAAISAVHRGYGYFLDPHGAVGWRAAERMPVDGPLAVLGTAHPAKFAETVEPLAGALPVPASIAKAMARTAAAKNIPNKLEALREFLLA
ncbi:MAG: threonine synthase [Treponema sp.]|jgi:threonine synthase|nr:threonine synthase [Treponema sp.]